VHHLRDSEPYRQTAVPFELISARAFAGGHSLYDLWNGALERHPILGDFGVKPSYLLQCITLRLGVSCKRRSVISLHADDIARGWESAVTSVAAVLMLLRDECGVLTSKMAPLRADAHPAGYRLG